MSSRKSLSAIGALIGIAVILVAGTWVLMWWASREQAGAKSTLASGYDAHSLFAPFTFTSKTWTPNGGLFSSSGTWTYNYTTSASSAEALASAEKQLSLGGYQVVATSPDVIGSNSAILYRDLITGDDSVKAVLNLETKPVTAVVTVSPLEGQ